MTPGQGPFVHDEIDSTNLEARRQVDAGVKGPLWIAARRQTLGRGRRGRAWSSEPGNLAATLVTPIPGGPAEAGLYSFTAALAVSDTLQVLAPGQDIALKWPNDVLLNRGKACGILLESLASGVSETTLAIGIGLNLSHSPDAPDAIWPPTSVFAETGQAPEFGHSLNILIDAVSARLQQHRSDGFGRIRKDWLERAINLGGDIEVRLPKETLHGRFAGLDTTGALMLEGPTGQRLIAAGDVFFPGDG